MTWGRAKAARGPRCLPHPQTTAPDLSAQKVIDVHGIYWHSVTFLRKLMDLQKIAKVKLEKTTCLSFFGVRKGTHCTPATYSLLFEDLQPPTDVEQPCQGGKWRDICMKAKQRENCSDIFFTTLKLDLWSKEGWQNQVCTMHVRAHCRISYIRHFTIIAMPQCLDIWVFDGFSYNLVLRSKCIESTAMHPFLTPRSCAPRQFGQDVSVTNSWQVGVFDDDHLRHFWRDPQKTTFFSRRLQWLQWLWITVNQICCGGTVAVSDLFLSVGTGACPSLSQDLRHIWWACSSEPKNLRSREKSTSITQHYQVSTRSVPTESLTPFAKRKLRDSGPCCTIL